MRCWQCQAGASNQEEDEGMAKDKNLGKLKSRFEVRGGVINEFDFQQNQGALVEEERDRFARQEDERELREGEAEQQSPQSEAERIERMMAEAHGKAEKNLRRKEKESKSAATPQARKSGAKKASGKKSASKAQASKHSAKKYGGSKGAGKKSVARKSKARGR
jgi:hypothetical protein